MSWISGNNCKLGYKDEDGDYDEQELEEGGNYKITIKGKFRGFEGESLIFETIDQEVSIQVDGIIDIEEA